MISLLTVVHRVAAIIGHTISINRIREMAIKLMCMMKVIRVVVVM